MGPVMEVMPYVAVISIIILLVLLMLSAGTNRDQRNLMTSISSECKRLNDELQFANDAITSLELDVQSLTDEKQRLIKNKNSILADCRKHKKKLDNIKLVMSK